MRGIMALLLVCISIWIAQPVQASAWETKIDVPTNKVWEIEFSSFVDEDMKQAITITDENGKSYTPTMMVDETIVRVSPPAGGYKKGSSYTLTVNEGATSMYGEKLVEAVELPFMIEEESHANVSVNANVKTVTDIELVAGSTYVQFGEAGKEAESFILPLGYKVGDIIKMEPNDDYPSGFIRKIVASVQKQGRLHVKTVFPTLEEAFAELDVNETFELRSEDVIDMELADRVVLASQDMSNGWEFALLDYMTTVEGQQYGVTGSIKFDHMSIDLDFNKRKLTNGPHAVTLNAAMVASVSIEPKVAVPLKKMYKEMLNKDVELGKFTYRLPYGLTVELHAGIVLRPSIMMGARVAYTNTTSFKLGAMYERKKFSPIAEFHLQNEKASTIYGGVQLKMGPRFTVEAGYLTLGIVNLHNDFGAYVKMENHVDIEGDLGACRLSEAGVFYDMLLEIPALERIAPLNTFPLTGKSLMLAKNNGCEFITELAFANDTLTVEEGKVYDTRVNASWKDVVTGQTGKQNVTDDVTYSTTDARLRISKSGKIDVRDASESFKATVKATYKHNGRTYTDTLAVTVKGKPADVEPFMASLEKNAPRGYEVTSIDSYFLTGNDNPEVVAVYFNYDEYESLVHVSTYEAGDWTRTYERTLEAAYYEPHWSGKLMNNAREQVVLAGYEGRSLSFVMLGSTNGNNVSVVIDQSDAYYSEAFMEEKNGSWRVCQSSQGEQYTWNGKAFAMSNVLCNPDPEDIKPGDIVVRYSIDAQNKITSNYPNNYTFTLKKGQNVHFIRENFGSIERILLDETVYTIIPAYYEWDLAYNYYFKYE